MGGGKAIDTAKIAADRASIPVIIVPTIASTDAPCSGCAVLYSEEGVFRSVHYQKMNPQVVLVDTRSSPRLRHASWFPGWAMPWRHGLKPDPAIAPNRSTSAADYSTMTGLNLAKLCYDTLLTYGAAAKIAC